MTWYKQTHWRILIALGLGLLYGVVAAIAGWGSVTKDWITPFGTSFLRLLLLGAVPLVLASLITGIASLADLRKLSRIGGKTIALYLSTTLVALISRTRRSALIVALKMTLDTTIVLLYICIYIYIERETSK